MRDMLNYAYKNYYAVGGCDLVSLDFLEAVIDAAERTKILVVLSLAEPYFAHNDFELILATTITSDKHTTVPVAVHLDHCQSIDDSAIKTINLGCNSIVLEASNHKLPGNIKLTHPVVNMAQKCGVSVIGALDYVAGKEGEKSEKSNCESILTVPVEAKVYEERTGYEHNY